MTEEDTRESMVEIDHTHPHTDEPFGEPYRGDTASTTEAEATDVAVETDHDTPEIRTDGGEPSSDAGHENPAVESVDDDREETVTSTMADVDHAGSDDGVARTFERGRVRTEDTE
jgi:hypothetical protein